MSRTPGRPAASSPPPAPSSRSGCAAAVTSGADQVVVTEAGAGEPLTLPVPTVADAVDATGAGDVLTGTTAARLALGDPLPTAVSLGIGAASLSVTGRGGTGRIPTLTESRAVAPAVRA
ncbi:PfkB family carbohydrate kinase [Streptomyces xiamenensis]|uniref:PfkB family carbohydrate kinase n=1 Tax=Streptomyces xiamenensis TaxID=408015 RepID=UPI000D149B62|nr:PfkB family carbohydrate kinase [Streptomyces xiamenensis]